MRLTYCLLLTLTAAACGPNHGGDLVVEVTDNRKAGRCDETTAKIDRDRDGFYEEVVDIQIESRRGCGELTTAGMDDCADSTANDPAGCPTTVAGCSASGVSTCAICINPGATEVFDGVDNNCDGVTDEGFTNVFCDTANDARCSANGMCEVRNCDLTTNTCLPPTPRCAANETCDAGTGACTLCDDQNACTTDRVINNVCESARDTIPGGGVCCNGIAGTNSCADSLTCDETGTSSTASGECVQCTVQTVVTQCDDDQQCVLGAMPRDNSCEDLVCDDGNECTNDTAMGNACVPVGMRTLTSTTCCSSGTACAQGVGADFCTSVTGAAGTCEECLVETTCPDDGLTCTGARTCTGNSCGFAGDPCAGTAQPMCDEATDSCRVCLTDATCQAANPLSICDTTTGTCQSCDDGNACTVDSVVGTGICSNVLRPVTECCNDNSQCTSSQCSSNDLAVAGTCSGCTVDTDCPTDWICNGSNVCEQCVTGNSNACQTARRHPTLPGQCQNVQQDDCCMGLLDDSSCQFTNTSTVVFSAANAHPTALSNDYINVCTPLPAGTSTRTATGFGCAPCLDRERDGYCSAETPANGLCSNGVDDNANHLADGDDPSCQTPVFSGCNGTGGLGRVNVPVFGTLAGSQVSQLIWYNAAGSVVRTDSVTSAGGTFTSPSGWCAVKLGDCSELLAPAALVTLNPPSVASAITVPPYRGQNPDRSWIVSHSNTSRAADQVSNTCTP